MSLKKLHTLSTKSLHKNPYWEYKLDRYALPNGSSGEYHYVHSPGSAMVVPVDEAGKLVLVKQFRYLWQRESIEFPAGGIKDPDPFVTARNELAEEANIGAAVWKFVGEYNPYNGATDEVAKVFFASGLANSIREKDASEEFEVLKMEISEFQTAIEAGVIWDGMTLAAWMIARPTVLEYLANVKLRK